MAKTAPKTRKSPNRPPTTRELFNTIAQHQEECSSYREALGELLEKLESCIETNQSDIKEVKADLHKLVSGEEEVDGVMVKKYPSIREMGKTYSSISTTLAFFSKSFRWGAPIALGALITAFTTVYVTNNMQSDKKMDLLERLIEIETQQIEQLRLDSE